MSQDADAVKNQVREYIINTFLPGEDPSNLPDDLHLKESGVLDSVSTLKLVAHVEDTYGIAVAPHEASSSFETIDSIAELVASKS
jgi:acyl carrier protein